MCYNKSVTCRGHHSKRPAGKESNISMKHLLAAVNAKYIHTCLAVRYLKGFVRARRDYDVDFLEFTINQPLSFLLEEIYRARPDTLAFSCYLWNIGAVSALLPDLKKVLPGLTIILGGPEVSFGCGEVLHAHPDADCLIAGEGEAGYLALLDALEKGGGWEDVPNLVYRKGGQMRQNPPAPFLDMDALPFPYEHVEQTRHQILYYEGCRGCPFDCQYCLSGDDKTLRFKSFDKIRRELDLFLSCRVPQVKFVDRTFNCRPDYYRPIWQYLIERDNGVTNFHFELSADLLRDEDMQLLRPARAGLFQFEIGVQSTHAPTLSAIHRSHRVEKIFSRVKAVQALGNIHQHLDLIAGLPLEDYAAFARSFNDVFSLRPQQLQLGFLKLLHGSGLDIRRKELGLVSSSRPPYEILATPSLSFEELLGLKGVEDMVERYYNSGRFSLSLERALSKASSPFSFFEALSRFWKDSGCGGVSHTKEALYDILFQFVRVFYGPDSDLAQLMRFDIFRHEKAKKLPACCEAPLSPAHRDRISAFYRNPENIKRYLPSYEGLDPRQIARMTHLEIFPFDPRHPEDRKERAYLFDYRGKNRLTDSTVTVLPRA